MMIAIHFIPDSLQGWLIIAASLTAIAASIHVRHEEMLVLGLSI